MPNLEFEFRLLAKSLEEARRELRDEKMKNSLVGLGDRKDLVAALQEVGVVYDEQWQVFELKGIQFRVARTYPYIDRATQLSRREIDWVLMGSGWKKCLSGSQIHRGMYEDPQKPGEYHKLRDAYAILTERDKNTDFVKLAKTATQMDAVIRLMKDNGVTVDETAVEKAAREHYKNLPHDAPDGVPDEED